MPVSGGGAVIAGSVKARVRKGTLLTDAQLRALLECKNMAEIARLLSLTYYAPFLPSEAESLHRHQLESVLLNVINNEALSFLPCFDIERRRFLRVWMERLDVLIIKNKIRKLFSGAILPHRPHKNEYNAFTLIDRAKLAAANGLPEIIASIKNRNLVTYLEEAVKRSSGGSRTAFILGMALDLFHMNEVFDAINEFSGDEKRGLMALIGTSADLMNITWIYRAKRFFRMSDETALSLVLDTRYRVQYENLRALSSMPPERMGGYFVGTVYEKLLPSLNNADDESALMLIDRNSNNIKRDEALRFFAGGGMGLHVILAYLILMDIEVYDTSSIIEMVRYDYDRTHGLRLLSHRLV